MALWWMGRKRLLRAEVCMFYVPGRVMVVEDDDDDFELIRSLLRELYGNKCEVTWVNTSVQARELIPLQTADVYLIDYRLDEKTGVDLLKEFKEFDLTRPMIFLTGLDEMAIDFALMESGASDYLPKQGLTLQLLERSIRYSAKRAFDKMKLREAARLKAEADAVKNAADLKSKIIAKINHELRTPLTAILGYATLALGSAKTVQEKNRYLDVIDRNGKHLLEIINDFLDLAKVEAHQQQFNKKKFEVMSVVDEVVELMRPSILAKGLVVQIERPNHPIDVESDPFRVRQILTNLIANAMKFTAVGFIAVKCERTRDWLKIYVSDTGVGIDVNDQSNIFQPFYQVPAEIGKNQSGTGLGLQLSRQLAVALGGRLELIQSRVGVGSTFALLLPITEGKDNRYENSNDLAAKNAI